MGKSKIKWTDAVWNPVIGCAHVSAGCDNCYAARETAGRLSTHPAYRGLATRTPGDPAKFTGEVRLLPDRLGQPLRWRTPRRIFVNSMSDLFHADVPREYVARVFAVMALAPQHQFQILTKRPGRMRLLMSDEVFAGQVIHHQKQLESEAKGAPITVAWPLPNVWLGVSVEDQHAANTRIPPLLGTPATVRFLSCEPLLGPITLADTIGEGDGLIGCNHPSADGIDRVPFGPAKVWRCAACHLTWIGDDVPHPSRLGWIIVGGESGPGARPMHPDWARDLRDEAALAGIPYLFKQWGEWRPARGAEPYPRHEFWASDRLALTIVHRVGKKAAGRELDGRTWDQYPVPA